MFLQIARQLDIMMATISEYQVAHLTQQIDSLIASYFKCTFLHEMNNFLSKIYIFSNIVYKYSAHTNMV